MSVKEYPLDSPIGDVVVSVNGDGGVYVTTNSNGKYVTVRGVPIAFSFHLYREENGTFTIPQEPTGGFIAGEPVMRDAYTRYARLDKPSTPLDNVSKAAQKKIKDIIVPLANAWAQAHLDILAEAWDEYHGEKIRRQHEKIMEAEKVLAQKKQEFSDLKHTHNPYR